MRDRNVFGIKRALPRMSWSPRNLYNLYRRSLTELKDETVFTNSGNSLFQQRWKSKQLTRAYHGDFINEKIFKRWYLPSTLPDVRPRTSRIASSASAAASSSSSPLGTKKGLAGVGVMDDVQALMKWANRSKDAQREQNLKEEEDLLAQAPVASLMYEEVERRIDVFIFRCCFAHSVYDARRMVIHGWVKLNGRKHTNANTRIAPGDMVSVDPEAINFLQKPREPEKQPASESTESSTESSTEEGADAEASKDPSTPTREAIQYFREPNKDELTPLNLPPYSAPFIFIPAYIEVNFLTCSAVFVRRPTARYNYSEIPSPYEADGEIMRLSWEWYNKVRPRMRSKSQLARMPENRKEVRVIPGVSAHPAKMSTTALI
ncbi:alpha-L RNA-binding motif-containing protein [Sanghuangporus baumii]|uniref:Alpha-L RNA-binding motif-containing protein n=1 Tax=Sanghuangporus baumii TaxID=108892 RepID=A0A9Q5I527_SANBA|nr:alpha-L RNA-binding motif-containing protein [Sanghuangporus baumii]